MPLELTVALIVFLGLIVWRTARRGRPAKPHEPLPEVEDAPPSADPAFVWRYIDDGLYSRYLDEMPPRRSRDGTTHQSIS
ncbi:MAG TPA: hypothetical protein VJ975_06715 [Candidatus Limnocylindria bacterium]|nr:hypothetical protein [Candidatus Limnocylindria bacterium]